MLGSIYKISLVSAVVAISLIGCGGNDTVLPTAYEVKVTNLTNFQPLSPVGFRLHTDGHSFEVGSTASLALEQLAEGGDNTGLLAEGGTSATTDGILLPGETAVLNLNKKRGEFLLSAFSMLVNTNDGFTGIDGYALDTIAIGETVVINTNAYDAGTESNTEAAGTIPGPADGGEGFNAQRDDVDIVRMHSGVVSKDDGLSSSVLTEQAKFDNPVMRVSIRRIR